MIMLLAIAVVISVTLSVVVKPRAQLVRVKRRR